MNIVQYIIIGCFVWGISSGSIHLILNILGVWDKKAVNFHLPKSKKYLTKVDPIYKIYFWFDLVYVQKWELKYVVNDWLSFLLIMFPYPIRVMSWKYSFVDHYLICTVKDFEKFEVSDLKTIYEEKDKIEQEKIRKKRASEYHNELKINSLNKIFNENYE